MLADGNDHWVLVGAFWATLGAAVATVIATLVNYYLLRAHVDPHVIVYVELDEARPSIILLVIENVGRGLAKNIRFSFDKPIPANAFGFENAPMPKQMVNGPLVSGIPAMGPGAKRIITWGQYGGILKGVGDGIINVTVYFQSDEFGPFERTDHEVVCPIEIKSFEGTDASDKNYGKFGADQLKRIADTLNHAATGFKPIKVELKEHE